MKVKKTRKVKKVKPRKFHFYDDQQFRFTGVTFSDDGDITGMMCTGDIVCHKIKQQYESTFSPSEIDRKLNVYLSKISNPGMREFIRYRHMYLSDSDKPNARFAYFSADVGMTDRDIYPLCDPNLRDVVIGFDMDGTLHQLGYFTNVPTKELVSMLSRLTKTRITYNDVGEMYFGGKERLAKFRVMFQNLAKTIGLRNVYIITANPSTKLKQILPDLYSTIFRINFPPGNVRVCTDTLTKYDIIKDIMK
jgi:hypothetical protein